MTTKTTIDHYKDYAALCEYFGVGFPDGVYMGMDRESWTKTLAKDEHLNNVKLSYWDQMGSWLVGKPNPFKPELGLSMAEAVCIMKHAVIYKLIGAVPVFE